MSSDAPDFADQRSFIAAKIAAANAAAAAGDATLTRAVLDFSDAMRDYFSLPADAPRAKRQNLTIGQLIPASRACDTWWLFGGETTPVVVGFDSRLVSAAADFAILRRMAPTGDAAPTPVDRSIASALARRLAGVGFSDGDKADTGATSVAGTSLEALLASNGSRFWRLTTFCGRLPETGDDFVVMIGQPEASVQTSAQLSGSPLTRETLAKIRGISVSAICVGGHFEAPLGRVLALKPGDIIPIEWKGDGAAPLMLDRRQFAAGALGNHNGRRALRL